MLNIPQERQRSAERRRVKEAAPSGPWEAVGPYEECGMYTVSYQETEADPEVGYDGTAPLFAMGSHWCGQKRKYVDSWGVTTQPVANFIAHARNDAVEDLIDSLLDEVERLTNELEKRKS